MFFGQSTKSKKARFFFAQMNILKIGIMSTVDCSFALKEKSTRHLLKNLTNLLNMSF